MKTLLTMLCILFTALSTRAQLLPPSAAITNIQLDGSGCDASNANAIFTDNAQFLSVLYDRFSAEIGKGTSEPNSKATEKRCTVLVDINVPQGWTFDIDSIEFKGYVEIPNQLALAYQLVTAEIYGGKAFGFDQALMRGPKIENFTTTVKNVSPLAKILGGSLSCQSTGQNIRLKIKSVIGVRNLLASLVKPAVKIVVDSTDASFKQKLKLNWRRCQ